VIELSIAEYEAIRSSPVQFPIKPGHDFAEFERVVEEHEHYAVVEKFGEARSAFAHAIRFRDCRLGSRPSMEEDEETRGEKLKTLRRRVAEDWLDGPGKETALRVLDEMVLEAAGEWPPNSD
jgi:hypothetical protein